MNSGWQISALAWYRKLHKNYKTPIFLPPYSAKVKEIFYKLRGNAQEKDISEPAAGNATFVIFAFMYYVMCQEVSRCKVVSDRLCITCFFVFFFFFLLLLTCLYLDPQMFCLSDSLPHPAEKGKMGRGKRATGRGLSSLAHQGQLTPELLRLYLAVVQVIAISVQWSTFLHTFWNRSILKSTLEEERMLSWQNTLRTG